MGKLRFAAMLGKTMGYISFGVTQTLRLSNKAAKKISALVQNKTQYNITVIDKNGAIIKEYTAVTQVKVNEVMTAMHHLHDNYKVTIEEYDVTIQEPS
tara:strand:+ start:251 stop:544 length:294 start_codon:yes stop_codon:yes gene_type:complete